MFWDLLSSRLIQGGLVFFVIVVGGSLLYSWHVHRTTEADFAKRPQQVVSPLKNKPATNAAPIDFQTEGVTNTPDENTKTQMPDETEAETRDETEFSDLVDAFLPDDVSADALDPSKMSRFGLGPYPEIPKEWNYVPNYWELMVDSIEDELLCRVFIKMKKEGTRSKYGSVGINPSTGLIIALERGSVLVEYEIDKNGEKRIWRTLAHPHDLSQGMYTRESQIPSDLKIVTAEEIGFDPYEYLGLSK